MDEGGGVGKRRTGVTAKKEEGCKIGKDGDLKRELGGTLSDLAETA